ncbi:MAG TPA: ABC transporter permease subunit [Pseudonocardiaceae bacterium]|nr:ABC transporter permease subunit [Pseudonocardiaceae bacterium]
MSGRSRRVRWTPVLRDRLLLVAGGVAVWQLVVSVGWVDRSVVPAPWEVALSIGHLGATPAVDQALLGTVAAFGVAFALAAVAGLAVGAVLGTWEGAYRMLYGTIAWVNGIPKLVFLPVFVLTTGIGYRFQVTYAFVAAVLPVIITVAPAIRSVDRRLVVVARSLGASRRQVTFKVLLPASVPAVVTALWYASEYALLGIVLTELFISPNGVGQLIRTYTSSFRPNDVFALLFVLAAVGTGLSAGVHALAGQKARAN